MYIRDKAHLMKKPSIDRKDNDKNYTLENCRFIELQDNVIKSNKEENIKSIIQCDLYGNVIREWKSATEASIQLVINKGDIGQCCLGKQKTCHGFIWRYKNDR